MAEIFGIAAGGVGVASLAVQLLDSLKKLREFKATYTEAPTQIQSLISELEQLRRIIDQLPEAQPSAPGHNNADLLQESADRCQKLRTDVHQLLHDLDLAVETRPRKGKLKYAFQKSTIQSWMLRLAQAKCDAMMALQIYHGRQSSSSFKHITAEMAALRSTQENFLAQLPTDQIVDTSNQLLDIKDRQRNLETQIHGVQEDAKRLPLQFDSLSQRLTELRQAVGSQHSDFLQRIEFTKLTQALGSAEDLFRRQSMDLREIQAQVHRLASEVQANHRVSRSLEEIERIEINLIFFRYTRERKRTGMISAASPSAPQTIRGTYRAVIKLPRWFLQQQWAIAVLSAQSGWQYSLRIFRVMPDTHEIFELCMAGDVDAVQEQVELGNVSIYDQNAQGHTLLHVAAFAHRRALCGYLITAGATPHALSDIEESPLHEMLYLIPQHPSVRETLELFRLLSNAYDTEDPITGTHCENARLLLTSHMATEEEQLLLILKLHQPPMSLQPDQLTVSQQEHRVQSLRNDMERLKNPFVTYVNGPDGLCSILHLAAIHFLQCGFYATDADKPIFAPWRQLCLDALSGGADLHRKKALVDWNDWSTPLGCALRRMFDNLFWENIQQGHSKLIAKKTMGRWSAVIVESGRSPSQYWTVIEDRMRESSIHFDRRYMGRTKLCEKWTKFKEQVTIVASNTTYDGKNALGSEERCRSNNDATDCSNTPRILLPGLLAALDHVRVRESSCEYEGDVEYFGNEDEREDDPPFIPTIPGAWPRFCSTGITITNERATYCRSDILSDWLNSRTKKVVRDTQPGTSWSELQEVLSNSHTASAYRGLRLGIDGCVEASRVDFGHGDGCHCERCHNLRKERERERELQGAGRFSGGLLPSCLAQRSFKEWRERRWKWMGVTVKAVWILRQG